MFKLIALYCLTSLCLSAAEPVVVNSQWPTNTICTSLTKPGVEVDLGRNWTQFTPGTTSYYQWRVGLFKYADVRFNKDMAALQTSFNVTDITVVGVQKSWGHDYDKWLGLLTQQVGKNLYVDVNLGNMRNTTVKENTLITSCNFYYADEKVSFGAEIYRTKDNTFVSTTSMVWGQYILTNKVGIWIGINREFSLPERSTSGSIGMSLRL